MTRRLLVTGAGGFVGGHVCAAAAPGAAFADWDLSALPKGLDIRSQDSLDGWLAGRSFDGVIHLAAQSFVPRSFEAPAETLEINTIGTSNLIESLQRHGFRGRMLYVSSGDVYGRVEDERLPVDERTPAFPRSPYAVSKLAAELRCLQAMRSDGLDVVVARPFNHIGPGQSPDFVLPGVARQLAAIREGRMPPRLQLGDIDATRDFTDVRDVVSAYAAVLSKGVPGTIYPVASGHERSIRSVVARLIELACVSVEIDQDPTRLRPTEQKRMVADASLLRRHTGWAPSTPFDTTLTDIIRDASSPA